MKLPPLSVLETWPTPNYIDPVTRGSAVLVVNIVMISLAFVVTCLRVYTRLKIAFSPGADDVLIMIAMVCVIETTHAISANVHRGLPLDCARQPQLRPNRLALTAIFGMCR